jgi:hypothetical protein
MHDPTFDAVAWLEEKKIRQFDGCAKCKHKGEMVWGVHLCKLEQRKNKNGYCNRWKFDEG